MCQGLLFGDMKNIIKGLFKTTVRKKIYCLKCDSELRQLLKTDSINDNWICPKHGSVKKGYIKTVNL